MTIENAQKHTRMLLGGIILCLGFFIAFPLTVAQGQTDEELRQQIQAYNAQLAEIEAEIAKYELELQVVGAEKTTLQRALQELYISRQRIGANINAAHARLNAATLEIVELERDIADKVDRIQFGNEALKEAIRRLDEAESYSLVETILGTNSMTTLWESIETIQQFQNVMRNHIHTLRDAREALEDAKRSTEQKRELLESEQNNLTIQRRALDANRRETNSLLERTKEEEGEYQKLLEEKREARRDFEQQLFSLESELEYRADPARIPPAGKGILRWPLSNVHVTQYFGDTAFARSGGYNGQGHNGVDFRASRGTPITSSLAGVVQGVGNTDAVRGCFSYGKWVLVRHANGLTTLYAHLDDIFVTEGQTVAMGEVVGLSGNTGYSTGPHLHFTVFVSSEVQIMRLGDFRGRVTPCANARIPVAPLQAYLNPLDYL